MHVVYEWALGVAFEDICERADVQEGSIVRCITRLDEFCRESGICAQILGNPIMCQTMEAVSVAIKRDVAFASSLDISLPRFFISI